MALLKNPNEVRQEINKHKGSDDPDTILSSVGDLISSNSDSNKLDTLFSVDLGFFKASSLNEFDNGVLMIEAVPDEYRTFAIDLLRQLIRDYNCQTVGEKATAELLAFSFVSILVIKKQIAEAIATHNALFYAHRSHGESPDKCIACERSKIELENRKLLSKELDQVSRCYLATIQTLRIMKQAPLQFNINANIGQNQIIQTKNG